MSRSRSRKQDAPTSPPSTSQQVLETNRDPTFLVVSRMGPEAVGRAVGQTYYDLALKDPVMVMGGSGPVGEPVKSLMIREDGLDWSDEFRGVAEQYLRDSLVSHNPQAAAVGICRLAAMLHYMKADPYGS